VSLIDSIERIKGQSKGGRFDEKLFEKPAPRFDVEKKRVLIAYLFGGLGDAALLAPALVALAARKPKAPIGVLTLENSVRILKTLDLPLKFHIFPEELLPGGLKGKAATAKKDALLKELRAKKYEIAADLSLRDELDARPYIKNIGAQLKLGFVRPGEDLETIGLDFGAADTRAEAAMHWSRALVQPLASLGVDKPIFELPFIKDEKAKAKADAMWGEESRSPRILLVPGGKKDNTRWHESRFAAVGRYAVDKRDARVVVCGAPSEAALVRVVKKATGKDTQHYIGKDLLVLRELIGGADVIVTNDTGPMHLSFLLERPTIAVFRYMSPVVWGPPKNDPDFVVLSAHRDVDPPKEGSNSSDDVWTRLVIHHLDRLLVRRTRKRR
jgi:ADP-heptose:LPS heptosyltransferase